MRSQLFILGLLSSALYGQQEVSHYLPKIEHKELLAKTHPPGKYAESVRENRVLLPELKGIIISGDSNMPPCYVLQSVKGVEFYRMKTVIGGGEKLRRTLNETAICKPLTEKGLKKIKNYITEYYRQRGEHLVHVYVPEQEIQDGIIVVNVIEACLGKVCITGNCWFSENLYLGALNLQPNQAISSKKIEHNVTWLNRSPWRKVCVVYKPGDRFGSTDVEVVVRDERPIKAHIGADNSGFKLTGYERVFFGFNWGNFLNLDQIIGYQYTASPDFHKFQCHNLHYTVPLPWHHLFIAFGGVSYIKGTQKELSETVQNVQQGTSWQFSPRYVIPLDEIYSWKHDIRGGFDWKRTDNNLDAVNQTTNLNTKGSGPNSFVSSPINNSCGTIFQGMVGYEGYANCGSKTYSAKIEAFLQAIPLGEGMTKERYKTLRADPDTVYLYTRFTAGYNWDNPNNPYGMGVDLRFTGQVTTSPLLPLELLGLGGFNSVRGYVDRAANVDNGFIFNLEVRSSRWSFFRDKRFSCWLGCDSLTLVGFFDMGYGRLLTFSEGEPSKYFLAGVGSGIRYDYGTWLRSRFDIGIPFTDISFNMPLTTNALPNAKHGTVSSAVITSRSFVQVYFSVMLSY